MKLVVAIINHFMLDKVCTALEELGVHGMTVTQARGVGKQDAQAYCVSYRRHSTPKIRLDVAVPEPMAARVVAAILDAAHTGRVGDGRVLVLELHEAVRIRDGQRGPEVL